MTAIPVLILLLGAVALWIMKSRSERLLWTVAATTAATAWISALILAPWTPMESRFSTWRPATLFVSRLSLSLDPISWPLVVAALTCTLAVLLAAPALYGSGLRRARPYILLYSALSLLALEAANILTVIVAWTLVDLAALLFILSGSKEQRDVRQLYQRAAIDLAGMLLLLVARLFAASGEFAALGGPSIESALPASLLAIAVLIRLGLLPLHFVLPPLSGERRGVGTLLRLFPPVVSLTVLARVMAAGIPIGLAPWLQIAGFLGLLVGGVRWVLARDIIRARPYMVLTVAGTGLWVASGLAESAASVMTATLVLLLLAGVTISLAERYERWHAAFPVLAALLFAGVPFSPGAVILKGALSPQRPGLGLIWTPAALLGLAAMAAGALSRLGKAKKHWIAGERLARWTYSAGLLLPTAIAALLAPRFGAEASIQGALGFVIAALLAAGIWWWRRRLLEAAALRLERMARWLDFGPLYACVAAIYRSLLRVLKGVANALEGKAGLLWLYLVLLLLLLAVPGSGV